MNKKLLMISLLLLSSNLVQASESKVQAKPLAELLANQGLKEINGKVYTIAEDGWLTQDGEWFTKNGEWFTKNKIFFTEDTKQWFDQDQNEWLTNDGKLFTRNNIFSTKDKQQWFDQDGQEWFTNDGKLFTKDNIFFTKDKQQWFDRDGNEWLTSWRWFTRNHIFFTDDQQRWVDKDGTEWFTEDGKWFKQFRNDEYITTDGSIFISTYCWRQDPNIPRAMRNTITLGRSRRTLTTTDGGKTIIDEYGRRLRY